MMVDINDNIIIERTPSAVSVVNDSSFDMMAFTVILEKRTTEISLVFFLVRSVKQ